MRFASKVPLFVALLLTAIGAEYSFGQVAPATRGGAPQANVFGMFTFNKPDYAKDLTYGGTFGADYRLGLFRFAAPAIAARISIVPGGIVGENSYLFGPEVHFHPGAFIRPYGDFHLGFATINYSKKTEEAQGIYEKAISSRSGFAYEFGGGVELRLKRHYGLRLIDLQYQNWNVGKGNVVRPGETKPPLIGQNVTYTPFQISTGFYYRFH